MVRIVERRGGNYCCKISEIFSYHQICNTKIINNFFYYQIAEDGMYLLFR